MCMHIHIHIYIYVHTHIFIPNIGQYWWLKHPNHKPSIFGAMNLDTLMKPFTFSVFVATYYESFFCINMQLVSSYIGKHIVNHSMNPITGLPTYIIPMNHKPPGYTIAGANGASETGAGGVQCVERQLSETSSRGRGRQWKTMGKL